MSVFLLCISSSDRRLSVVPCLFLLKRVALKKNGDTNSPQSSCRHHLSINGPNTRRMWMLALRPSGLRSQTLKPSDRTGMQDFFFFPLTKSSVQPPYRMFQFCFSKKIPRKELKRNRIRGWKERSAEGKCCEARKLKGLVSVDYFILFMVKKK